MTRPSPPDADRRTRHALVRRRADDEAEAALVATRPAARPLPCRGPRRRGAESRGPSHGSPEVAGRASSDLLERAEAWVAEDPDPETRAELERCWRAESGDARPWPTSRTGSRARLEFGTAGLRGALGAGPNRMNRVGRDPRRRRARGVPARRTARPTATVVIGYDARHKSDVFAARHRRGDGRGRAARARAARARCRRRVLAFAIRHLGCRRRRDGDRAATTRRRTTATRSTSATAARSCRRPTPRSRAQIDGGRPAAPTSRAPTAGEVLGDDVLDALPRRGRRPGRRRIAARPDASSTRRCTASAATTVATALRAGRLRGAASWCRSRPSPTRTSRPSRFPNPEEPGAMDLALALAAEVGADLVVANDPDADRCAVAVPGPRRLADAARRRGRRAARRPPAAARTRAASFATSIVSSSLLGKMAEAARACAYAETLTGFKWIGRVAGPRVRLRGGARLLRRPGPRARQGRRSRRCCWSPSSPRALKARGPHAARPARRHRARARRCTPPTSSRCGSSDLVADRRRRWSGCATTPPHALGGLAVEQDRRPVAGRRRTCRPTDGLRYRLAERRPGGRAAVGHRAEAQVLPRGRRPGRGRRRRRASTRPASSAVGRLDAIRADLQAAAGLWSPSRRTTRPAARPRAPRPARSATTPSRGVPASAGSRRLAAASLAQGADVLLEHVAARARSSKGCSVRAARDRG